MKWFKKNIGNIVLVHWGFIIPALALFGILVGAELSNYTLLFFLSIGVAQLLLKDEGVEPNK